MMKFVKSLLGATTHKQPSVDKNTFTTMSVDDIVGFITNRKDASFHTDELIGCLQRLYEIGLLENFIPDQKREVALKLAAVVTKQLEDIWAGDTKSIEALKAADDAMAESAKVHGYGSLIWKIKEEQVPDDHVIAYAMKPEHRDLVPNFLSAIGDELKQKGKREYIRQLILSEDYEGGNAVIMLHGLAAKGDRALAALVTPAELSALYNVPQNYAAGRGVLVSLGLLPKEGGARAFKPVSEIQNLVAYIIKSRKEEERDDPRLKELNETEKTVLLLALDFLRISLAHAQLQQIYGKETAESLIEIFKDPAVRDGIERISKLPEVVSKYTPGAPLDSLILNEVLSWEGHSAKTEEEHQKLLPYLNMGGDWLNHERVEFLSRFRFMLRAAGDPLPEAKSEADQEFMNRARMDYRLKGANLSVAEKLINLEDWIGTTTQPD